MARTRLRKKLEKRLRLQDKKYRKKRERLNSKGVFNNLYSNVSLSWKNDLEFKKKLAKKREVQNRTGKPLVSLGYLNTPRS